MKIFISWSGDRTKRIATAVADSLQLMNGRLEPFISTQNIESGSAWPHVIAENLAAHDAGIACMTVESYKQPWLQFESGAICKGANSRLIPLLLDIDPKQLSETPLGGRHFAQFSESGFRRMVFDLNKWLDDRALSHDILNRGFLKHWPELENTVRLILAEPPGVEHAPPDPHMRELLSLSREQAKRSEALKKMIVGLAPADIVPATNRDVALLCSALADFLGEVSTRNDRLFSHIDESRQDEGFEIWEKISMATYYLRNALEQAAKDGGTLVSLKTAILETRRGRGTLMG